MRIHIRRLDRYIKELALIEDGGKLGELRFGSTEPLVSRAWTTIEQTYTVGEQPIAAGGGFMLGVAGTGQEGRPQHEDPKAPGLRHRARVARRRHLRARDREVERRARRGARRPLRCRSFASAAQRSSPATP